MVVRTTERETEVLDDDGVRKVKCVTRRTWYECSICRRKGDYPDDVGHSDGCPRGGA
jgi:hypothetical protein